MVAPFPALSFSFFFLFSCIMKHQTLHAYLSIFVLFICVTFVTYTNTACFISFLCLFFVSSFQCFVWLPIRFRSVSLSLSLHSSNRPTPPPFHDTESVATPFLNFFIFLVFKNFFGEKNAV